MDFVNNIDPPQMGRCYECGAEVYNLAGECLICDSKAWATTASDLQAYRELYPTVEVEYVIRSWLSGAEIFRITTGPEGRAEASVAAIYLTHHPTIPWETYIRQYLWPQLGDPQTAERCRRTMTWEEAVEWVRESLGDAKKQTLVPCDEF